MGFLKTQIKSSLCATPLVRLICPRYIHNMSPAQLAPLNRAVEQTRELPGAIPEIGRYVGATTIWLNQQMDALGIEKPYDSIDTFSGFTEDAVDFEVQKRGKSASIVAFDENSQKRFGRTMRPTASVGCGRSGPTRGVSTTRSSARSRSR